MSAPVKLTPFAAGPEAYAHLPQFAAAHGSELLLIGGERALQAGKPRLLKASRGSGLSLVGCLQAAPVCSHEAALHLARQARALGARLVLGMGGGRALDQAKAAAELAGLPVICLPTIAATCAATSGLSVLYREDGSFDRFLFLSSPPEAALIDTAVLARAPACYLRAGIGDSLAKHVEALFSARGADTGFEDMLGLHIAEGLFEGLLALGAQALRDNGAGLATEALQQAALLSIVSVGYVSLLVQEGFNGALAHSLYYALEPMLQGLPVLHGDVVAWGALCQLWLDGQQDKALRLRAFLQGLSIPVNLQQMGLRAEDPALQALARQATAQPDMALLPYPITGEMIIGAIRAVEMLSKEELTIV